MFVELPEGKFLIDTGSPLTFGETPTNSVTYGSLVSSIPRALMGGMVSLKSLENLPGVDCIGLLGTNILMSKVTLFDGPNL